jgi:assimilatory nitrate reductase catalytic subunit
MPSAHDRAVAETPTHCPYCALQCGMMVGGTPVRITPRDGWAFHRGGLCRKGWAASDLLTGSDRLTTPMRRLHLGAPLEPCTWDQALDRIAAEITRLQRDHGHDAVAVFGGGFTNEKAYQLGKFARIALRTSQIDYNGRFCMSPAGAALNRAFGLDRGLPGPITDIGTADTVLLAGADAAETMPSFMRHLREQRRNGGTLIVIDPRRTAIARQADLHLQPTPGTDLALANGLVHLAIAEGLADEAYLTERTTGFERVRTVVNGYWPDRVERITGVPVPRMREAVRLLAGAQVTGVTAETAAPSHHRTALVLTACGAEQHATDTVTAFINLALVLGLPGRPGSGYGCVTGKGNGQGGRGEHGQKADRLPGYRRIDDSAARAHVAAVWGVDSEIIPGPGRSAPELLSALGTTRGPKALMVFGSNPVVSAPRAAAIEERLNALDLLVVADFVMSETAARADVVLPTTQWAEESGTMTNLEGRVVRRRQVTPVPDGVRSDLEVLAQIAGRLEAPGAWATEPAAVFDELRRASAGGLADYSGITYERIEKEGGVFWPCPGEGHPGTPRPFLDRFATRDGKARFAPVEHRGPAEDADADYPLYLTTGRVFAHYQSGAQSRRVRALADAVTEPYAEIHPDLAGRLGITEGALVRVTGRRGMLIVTARLTDTIRPDTVFVPFHWARRGQADPLTDSTLDPMSGMPEFKVCAVRVEVAVPAVGEEGGA